MPGMESTTEFPTWDELEAARAAGAERRAEGAESEAPEQFPDNLLQETAGGQVQLVVEGHHERLDSSVTGRSPTSSMLTITGGKVEVGGQYQEDDVVTFQVTVQVDEVSFRTQRDSKTGQSTGRERRHKGRIIGIHELEG